MNRKVVGQASRACAWDAPSDRGRKPPGWSRHVADLQLTNVWTDFGQIHFC